MQTANLLSLSHTCLLLPLMLRLLHRTAVQISLLRWKYGFLIHRYPGLNQFRQSWSPSRQLEWKQARIPTPLAAAGYPAPVLTWYNLPAWSSPVALQLLNWAPIPASPTYRDHISSRYTDKLWGGHVVLEARRRMFVCEREVLRAR